MSLASATLRSKTPPLARILSKVSRTLAPAWMTSSSVPVSLWSLVGELGDVLGGDAGLAAGRLDHVGRAGGDLLELDHLAHAGLDDDRQAGADRRAGAERRRP